MHRGVGGDIGELASTSDAIDLPLNPLPLPWSPQYALVEGIPGSSSQSVLMSSKQGALFDTFEFLFDLAISHDMMEDGSVMCQGPCPSGFWETRRSTSIACAEVGSDVYLVLGGFAPLQFCAGVCEHRDDFDVATVTRVGELFGYRYDLGDYYSELADSSVAVSSDGEVTLVARYLHDNSSETDALTFYVSRGATSKNEFRSFYPLSSLMRLLGLSSDPVPRRRADMKLTSKGKVCMAQGSAEEEA